MALGMAITWDMKATGRRTGKRPEMTMMGMVSTGITVRTTNTTMTAARPRLAPLQKITPVPCTQRSLGRDPANALNAA